MTRRVSAWHRRPDKLEGRDGPVTITSADGTTKVIPALAPSKAPRRRRKKKKLPVVGGGLPGMGKR